MSAGAFCVKNGKDGIAQMNCKKTVGVEITLYNLLCLLFYRI